MGHTTPRAAFEFLAVFLIFLTAEPSPLSLLIGVNLSCLGLALRIWARGYRRAIERLEVSGPYRFVRHPYTLGSSMFFFGLCLAGRNPYVTGAILLGMFWVYRHDFRKQEERFGRYLGLDYQDYRYRVPSFIPALLPYKQMKSKNNSKPSDFPWGKILIKGRHREIDAVFAGLIAYGLLYLLSVMTYKTLFHQVMIGLICLFVAFRFMYYAKFPRV